MKTHTRAVGHHPAYPSRGAVRKVSWSDADASYSPISFTHKVVAENSKQKTGRWADATYNSASASRRFSYFKTKGGKLKRKTIREAGFWHNNKPRNPVGRTGMIERGLLGKYGPNHACDAAVTRIRPGSNLLRTTYTRLTATGWRQSHGTWLPVCARDICLACDAAHVACGLAPFVLGSRSNDIDLDVEENAIGCRGCY